MAKTMKDIARELGLSRTTVSLVLQGRGEAYRISQATRKLVLDHVQENDFKPNYFAQALTGGRSAVIGAIFPDVFESFMSSLIRGIEAVLYRRGYSLMISTSHFDNEREHSIVEKMVWQGVDGIILVPSMPFSGQEPYDSSHIRPLVEGGYPLVVVDRTIPGLDTHRVLQRDYEMTRAALERFISAWPATVDQSGAGHDNHSGSSGITQPATVPRIACVSFDLEASSIQDRIRAYYDVMLDADSQPCCILLQRIDPESDDLGIAVTRLMASSQPPDAFFVTSSGLAEKLLWILKCSGPALLPAIVRFGASSRWLASPFIDIQHPHTDMGSTAANLILDLLDGTAAATHPAGMGSGRTEFRH
jgi:DNA-binding LacI/PurR family transcriptional regulator